MSPALLLGLGVVSLLLMGFAYVLIRNIGQEQRLAARLVRIQPDRAASAAARTPGSDALSSIAGFGGRVLRGGLLSRATVDGLEQTLRAAGFRGERALSLFVGAKISLFVLMPTLLGITAFGLGAEDSQVLLTCLFGAVMGLLLPDFVARLLRGRYLARLEVGLPDGLDLLVICAEAGLSLQPAMQRVAEEMAGVNSAVAAEFNLTLHELRVLSDRREALARMGKRTSVEALQRLAQSLVQSLQFGTPMSQALRMLAAEMRQEQLIKFEARAARLPVLLTLPMVFFILPTLFLVVGGPAAIQLMKIW